VRLLVTNDDGVDAPGLHALARALLAAGHDLVVAAPLDDRSGSGAAIGRLHVDDHIDVERREIAGLEGVDVVGVDGPPALCVLAARLGGFGDPPELVVSGINPGCNTGRAVLHSGTVGAALTAANFGVSAVAVSIDASTGLAHEAEAAGRADGDEPIMIVDPPAPHWETAAALAVEAVEWLAGAAPRSVVNLNVPDLPLDEVKGVRWAELAALGTVRSAVVESSDGRLQMELRASGVDVPADSDTGLVQAGYAAVTVINGVTATEPVGVAEHLDARTLPART
jgi:5'-nucleotidase